MEDPGFRALYEEKLKEMYEVVFTSGAARQTLEDYTHLIRSTQAESGLVDLDTYDQAAAEVENFLSERQAYLESTELLAGR
jgi:spore coat protein CotH